MDEASFFRFNEERALVGMPARQISSYVTNGRRLYAGAWSDNP